MHSINLFICSFPFLLALSFCQFPHPLHFQSHLYQPRPQPHPLPAVVVVSSLIIAAVHGGGGGFVLLAIEGVVAGIGQACQGARAGRTPTHSQRWRLLPRVRFHVIPLHVTGCPQACNVM